MERFRYSYNLIGYSGEELSRSIDRVARLGYDAVEVEGEPKKVDPAGSGSCSTTRALLPAPSAPPSPPDATSLIQTLTFATTR